MIHKLFTLPIRSLLKLGEKIQEEAEQELYDISYIQQQLVELHMLYEIEEIEEDSYIEREQELLARYQITKEREKDQFLGE